MTPGRPRNDVDPERHAADLDVVRRRTRVGDSANEIAIELRCTGRTVVRYRAELRAAGVELEPCASARPLVHGLVTTYVHRGCRCDDCTAAHTSYARSLRHNGAVLSHGASGYQRGCRCPVCFAWQSDQNRRRPPRSRKAAA